MSFSRKNIKQWQTTIIGLLLIAMAIYYLFVLEKESYTIFFGLLLLGILFVLAPDQALTNIGMFFRRFLKVFGSQQDDKPNIDIDIQAEQNDDNEKEIPPDNED